MILYLIIFENMFKITVKWDIQKILTNVQKEVEKNWGTMYTNWLEVKWVKIKFQTDWNNVFVQILDKPWLVSESYIEEKVREYFNS